MTHNQLKERIRHMRMGFEFKQKQADDFHKLIESTEDIDLFQKNKAHDQVEEDYQKLHKQAALAEQNIRQDISTALDLLNNEAEAEVTIEKRNRAIKRLNKCLDELNKFQKILSKVRPWILTNS